MIVCLRLFELGCLYFCMFARLCLSSVCSFDWLAFCTFVWFCVSLFVCLFVSFCSCYLSFVCLCVLRSVRRFVRFLAYPFGSFWVVFVLVYMFVRLIVSARLFHICRSFIISPCVSVCVASVCLCPFVCLLDGSRPVVRSVGWFRSPVGRYVGMIGCVCVCLSVCRFVFVSWFVCLRCFVARLFVCQFVVGLSLWC